MPRQTCPKPYFRVSVPAGTLVRDLDAPTNRTLRRGAGGLCSFRNTPANRLPLTPSRCIPIVEGRVIPPPPNHDSSVPAGTFDGFCT